MRKINWTRPGRAHVIRNEQGFYATLWLFGKRWHLTVSDKGVTAPLW